MTLGVSLPLIALGYFKYTAFALGNIDWLYDYWGAKREWSIAVLALPAGLSFYLFHTISYVIDVYRGAPTASFLNYLLYVAFFPQLVAGPIVRRAHFIPQTEDSSLGRPDWAKIHWGLIIFVFGLFQKVVMADGIFSDVSNKIFSADRALSLSDAWLGVMAFTGQIFFDFSGYSTCAIGISLCFGFRLPANFRYPYAAIGFSDFWQRWHISLSSWLRDYLYISLGGSRQGTVRTYRNLMLTMLLGGLWHGAAWTFVAWGFLHGLYLVGERALQVFAFRGPLVSIAGWLATLVLTMVAWVFFRAASFSDAVGILSAMFIPHTILPRSVASVEGAAVLAGFCGMIAYSLFMRRRNFGEVWSGLSFAWKVLLLGGAITMILTWRGEPREFIYFAF